MGSIQQALGLDGRASATVITPGRHGDWSLGFGPWEAGCRGSQRPTVGEVRSEKVPQPLPSNALSIPLATAAPILLLLGVLILALRHQHTATLIFLGQGTNACQWWGVLLGAQIQHSKSSVRRCSVAQEVFLVPEQGTQEFVALARTNQVRPLRKAACCMVSLSSPQSLLLCPLPWFLGGSQ